jgi:DNA-binding transcriptional ArsR family regulator
LEDSEDGEKDFDKIKVFSSDDEKLKILGELLSNKSSRDIIKMLIEKEMYTNEIAKKLELRPNLVIHHLQKMKSIGLLEITNKKITRKGEEHRFFKIPSGVFIVPNESKNIKENGLLKRFFKDGIKFASIFAAGLFTWLIFRDDGMAFDSKSVSDNYWIPLLIIIIGLLIERVLSSRKKEGDLTLFLDGCFKCCSLIRLS